MRFSARGRTRAERSGVLGAVLVERAMNRVHIGLECDEVDPSLGVVKIEEQMTEKMVAKHLHCSMSIGEPERRVQHT
jgi:hypothetical protein